MQQPVLTRFIAALLAIDRSTLSDIARSVASSDPLAPIDTLVVPALEQIGAHWEQGEVSLSQVYMSGRLCEDLIGELPLPGPSTSPHRAKRVDLNIGISTLDDYHVLGKRMVSTVLRAGGYQLTDYGTADAATLAEWVQRDRIQVLLLSVLMLPSALRIRQLRDTLTNAGEQTHILVGGAPFRFDPNLWTEVGADGVGASAADALALVQAATARVIT